VLLNFAGLPETAERALRQAAGGGVPLVAWLADHITALPPEILPNLDGVHAFDSATLDVLHAAYRGSGARLDFLPLAVNPARFPNYGKPWPLRHEGLVFLGNNTAGRRAMMQQFLDAGGVLTAYGPGAATGLRFWRRRRISPAGSARIYGSFQGVLNLLQAPNTVNGLNLRAFEVPASGGLGTYPYTPDLALSFVPDQEIIAYRNMDDLARQTRAIFHDPDQAAAMMTAGFKRVMADHTYACRAAHFIKTWLPEK
jgi:spore maturation protein CgeB